MHLTENPYPLLSEPNENELVSLSNDINVPFSELALYDVHQYPSM